MGIAIGLTLVAGCSDDSPRGGCLRSAITLVRS